MKRFLLAISALLLAIGALLHGSAFHKVVSALNESNLAPFAGRSLKVLWLQDSAVCLILAVAFGSIAVRPAAAAGWIVVLLALIPIATAGLIYTFIGNFIGGHVLLVAGVAALLGALLPGENAKS